MTEQAQALLAVLQAAMNSISATESALRDKGFALRAPEWDLMAFLEDFGPMRPAELLRLCSSPKIRAKSAWNAGYVPADAGSTCVRGLYARLVTTLVT
jgi:hypothetical protein